MVDHPDPAALLGDPDDDHDGTVLAPYADPCPQGCGNLTDDPYGGPCTRCWNAVYTSPCPWEDL